MGCRCLRISSLTLRSLGVSDNLYINEGKLEEVIIEDAPLLERLIPQYICWGDFVIRVIQAPKLKILGYLSDKFPHLSLEPWFSSLSNVMRTVKILALDTSLDLEVVIDFLKCFPCVEKLYIVAKQDNFKNVQRYDSIECLDLHLKMVEFIHYEGNMSDLNFTKFFVVNARVLQSMKFIVRRDKCDAEWLEKQYQNLQLYASATRGITFDFQATYKAGCGDS
uniref:Uncharacterized protein n=1 Tax=Leersia perrieri TaxID=77586 RepID=A0A0D9Y0A6_9ORYZ